MSNITDVLPGVAVTDLEAALPWYERLFGRPADERPMEGLAEWLFGGARLQLVESADRAGKSTVTLVVDDVKAYYEELGKRGLTPGAPDETISDKVLFGYIADPEATSSPWSSCAPAGPSCRSPGLLPRAGRYGRSGRRLVPAARSRATRTPCPARRRRYAASGTATTADMA
jgi:hypothetical protein